MIRVGNVEITRIIFHHSKNIQVGASVLGHSFDTTLPAEIHPNTSFMEVIRHAFRLWASQPDRRHAEEFVRALHILDGEYIPDS